MVPLQIKHPIKRANYRDEHINFTTKIVIIITAKTSHPILDFEVFSALVVSGWDEFSKFSIKLILYNLQHLYFLPLEKGDA